MAARGVKPFYVYDLIDPRDGSIFYVGKGRGSRVNEHENEARKGKQSRKCDRIREIWDAGHQVSNRIVKTFDQEDAAYDFEAKRTMDIGLENLTNEKLGGHGGRRMTSIDLAVERVRVAFWCLKRWNEIGRPLWVGVPGYGSMCLDGMLDRFGADIRHGVEKAGLARVSEIGQQYGVKFEVHP